MKPVGATLHLWTMSYRPNPPEPAILLRCRACGMERRFPPDLRVDVEEQPSLRCYVGPVIMGTDRRVSAPAVLLQLVELAGLARSSCAAQPLESPEAGPAIVSRADPRRVRSAAIRAGHGSSAAREALRTTLLVGFTFTLAAVPLLFYWRAVSLYELAFVVGILLALFPVIASADLFNWLAEGLLWPWRACLGARLRLDLARLPAQDRAELLADLAEYEDDTGAIARRLLQDARLQAPDALPGSPTEVVPAAPPPGIGTEPSASP